MFKVLNLQQKIAFYFILKTLISSGKHFVNNLKKHLKNVYTKNKFSCTYVDDFPHHLWTFFR